MGQSTTRPSRVNESKYRQVARIAFQRHLAMRIDHCAGKVESSQHGLLLNLIVRRRLNVLSTIPPVRPGPQSTRFHPWSISLAWFSFIYGLPFFFSAQTFNAFCAPLAKRFVTGDATTPFARSHGCTTVRDNWASLVNCNACPASFKHLLSGTVIGGWKRVVNCLNVEDAQTLATHFATVSSSIQVQQETSRVEWTALKMCRGHPPNFRTERSPTASCFALAPLSPIRTACHMP